MRDTLLEKLYNKEDPFADYPPDMSLITDFGWNSTHRMLEQSIEMLRPKIVIDAGVWMGGSCIHMAKITEKLGLDAQVIALDTFLGCDILRLAGYTVPMLRMRHGRPSYFHVFYANVFNQGLQKRIIPLHTDTRSGMRYLKRLGIKVDLIHHDATHYHPDVYEDLQCCWDVLRSGGHLIIDDYGRSDLKYPEFNDFNGLCDDVDRFAKEKEVYLEVDSPKARLVKP